MIRLTSSADCCGCTGCASICPNAAIGLITDSEGFTYPHVDETICINCNLCETVCPILNYDTNPASRKPATAIAAHVKDTTVWLSSSSGGVFTAMAQWTIEKGGTVYGACYDGSMKVTHAAVTNMAGIEKLRGSKYVQSDMTGLYKRIGDQLNTGGGRKSPSFSRAHLVRWQGLNAI